MAKVVSSSNTRCSLHDWRGAHAELAFIHDSKIQPDQADLSGEREREFSAWLVRTGWAQIESDGEAARAQAGQWLICFGRRVTQRFAPDTHLMSLRVLQSWPDGSPLFGHGALTVFDAAKHPALERHASRLLALTEKLKWNDGYTRDMRIAFHWRNQMDYFTFMNYQRHLQSWQQSLAVALTAAGRTINAPTSTDPRVARALQVINLHDWGVAYPEAELVRVSGLSIGRLNRLCAQRYGFTIHQYWERRRLERARLELKARSQSIKQIAFQLGFLQLSHFSAWFKRLEGMSPRAYRTEQTSRDRINCL